MAHLWLTQPLHREFDVVALDNFTEKHGINLEWLLDGMGRVFKKRPDQAEPNSTGAEFAAVVRTMPMADQQAIGAMLREMVQEREQ
jgi:hypothetical protein